MFLGSGDIAIAYISNDEDTFCQSEIKHHGITPGIFFSTLTPLRSVAIIHFVTALRSGALS